MAFRLLLAGTGDFFLAKFYPSLHVLDKPFLKRLVKQHCTQCRRKTYAETESDIPAVKILKHSEQRDIALAQIFKKPVLLEEFRILKMSYIW